MAPAPRSRPAAAQFRRCRVSNRDRGSFRSRFSQRQAAIIRTIKPEARGSTRSGRRTLHRRFYQMVHHLLSICSGVFIRWSGPSVPDAFIRRSTACYPPVTGNLTGGVSACWFPLASEQLRLAQLIAGAIRCSEHNKNFVARAWRWYVEEKRGRERDAARTIETPRLSD